MAADPYVADTPPNDSQPAITEETKPTNVSGVFSWSQIRRSARHKSLAAVIIFLLLIAGGVSYYLNSRAKQAKKQATNSAFPNQNPSFDTNAANQIKVGDADHVLTVQGQAYFQDKVAVASDLSVNGQISDSGTGTFGQLNVAGNSTLASGEVKSNFQVDGTTTFQGPVNLKGLITASGLNVSGNSSVGGSLSTGALTASGLTVNGPIQANFHILTGGGTPGVSAGGAVGSGGTASISGSDTAGTVNIGVGVGAVPGTLASIGFHSGYSGTPHVVLSADSSSAASVRYYVVRSSSGFTINTLDAPGPGTYTYDYFIAQ